MRNIILALALTLPCLAAKAADLPRDHAADAAKGLAILQTECSGCHALGREGASPNPKSPPFREVAKRYPPDSMVEALAEGIVTGHNDMPEFMFEPDEIIAIVSYLESLK